MRDRYIPDYSEVFKPNWTSNQYLIGQLETNQPEATQTPPAVKQQKPDGAMENFDDDENQFQNNTLNNSVGPRRDQDSQGDDVNTAGEMKNKGFAMSPSGDCDSSVSLPGLDDDQDYRDTKQPTSPQTAAAPKRNQASVESLFHN